MNEQSNCTIKYLATIHMIIIITFWSRQNHTYPFKMLGTITTFCVDTIVEKYITEAIKNIRNEKRRNLKTQARTTKNIQKTEEIWDLPPHKYWKYEKRRNFKIRARKITKIKKRSNKEARKENPRQSRKPWKLPWLARKPWKLSWLARKPWNPSWLGRKPCKPTWPARKPVENSMTTLELGKDN